MREKGFGIPGVNEKKIRAQAEEIVKKRREGIEKELAEKKKQREFDELSRHAGMNKGDMTRAKFAKR